MSPPAARATPNETDPVEAFRMPLMEHLRELRRRLLIALGTVVACCFGCFFIAGRIWDLLADPMNTALRAHGQGTMAITAPLEGFMTYVKVAGLAGLGLASPVVFWQVWRFVAPGLYKKEQRYVLPMVAASTVLFAAGVTFGYLVVFRYGFPYFLEITGDDVMPVLSMDAYLSMVSKLLLAFGICFQLPIVVFFLARIGLIDHRDMIRFFRYSVVGIFVVAAVLTPPDVLSQILMAAPLLVLYGLGIVVAWVFTTKKRS